jgi:hypothetical protein
MEISAALSLILMASLVPLVSGFMATCYRRSFWLWFVIGLLLPFISNLLLLLLPEKQAKHGSTIPVENDELFDHLFNGTVHHQKLIWSTNN